MQQNSFQDETLTLRSENLVTEWPPKQAVGYTCVNFPAPAQQYQQ